MQRMAMEVIHKQRLYIHLSHIDSAVSTTILQQKKKNMPIVKKTQPKSLHIELGLFPNKQSKQHILQDFKRGALFQYSLNKTQTKSEIFPFTMQEDNGCWINDILIGRDDWKTELMEQDIQMIEKTKKTEKTLKKLPNIGVRIKNNKGNCIIPRLYGCNKMICLQKKMSRQGVWNNGNKNNMEQNVCKIEQSLYLHPKQLTRNDFYRVKGLDFKNRSLEDSIHCCDNSAYTIHSSVNPFQNFPLYSSTFGNRQEHLHQQGTAKMRKKLAESAGHFVPSFLIQYLMINEGTLPKV